MKSLYLLAAVSAFAVTSMAYADGDMSRAKPEEIVVVMGQTDMKHMYFKPLVSQRLGWFFSNVL